MEAVNAEYLAMMCVMPTTKEMMDKGLLDSLVPKVFQDIIVTTECKDKATLMEDCDKVFLVFDCYRTWNKDLKFIIESSFHSLFSSKTPTTKVRRSHCGFLCNSQIYRRQYAYPYCLIYRVHLADYYTTSACYKR